MSRNPFAQKNVATPPADTSLPKDTGISNLSSNLHPLRLAFGRMPSNRLWLRIGVLPCALLIGVGGMASHARQAAGERENLQAPLLTGQIACVDMDRLYAASGGPEQLAQRATEIAQEVNARLKELKAVPLLDENELQEYGALLFKAVKTDADQTRMKALRAASDQRQDELNKLQIKPDATLTAEDKARMKLLQEQSRLLASIMPYWQEDARAQQSERLEAFRRSQMAKIRQIVGKAALERNIAHVFDTSALVYSANDLTAVVLSRVSKHAPKDSKDKDSKE